MNKLANPTSSTKATWTTPAYSAAGNITTIPRPVDLSQSFTGSWDAWNRLVKLVDDDTSDTAAEYQYDAQNRRIVKKLYASGTLDQTRNIYLSDQNQILEERRDASTAAALQNIWGLMYIDGLILRDRDTTGDGTLDERLYCLQDANWNTVAVGNTSGTITQRFCYEPYGTCEFLDASYDSSTNSSGWTTLFTGRELDLESLLYYFRARYLHPAIGTFLSRDPLGYIDGMNVYSAWFVPNGVDPNGHAICKCVTTNWSATGYGGGTSSTVSYSVVPTAASCAANSSAASSTFAGSGSGYIRSCGVNLGDESPLLGLCAGDPNPIACEKSLVSVLNSIESADNRALGTWEGWWEERGFGQCGGRCHLWSVEFLEALCSQPSEDWSLFSENIVIRLDASPQWYDHNITVLRNPRTGKCRVVDDGFWGGLGKVYDPCAVKPPLLGTLGKQQWSDVLSKCGCGR